MKAEAEVLVRTRVCVVLPSFDHTALFSPLPQLAYTRLDGALSITGSVAVVGPPYMSTTTRLLLLGVFRGSVMQHKDDQLHYVYRPGILATRLSRDRGAVCPHD